MAPEQDIKNAARICYAPNNPRYLAPLIFVIEELVVPDGVTGYTESDMERYISEALTRLTKRAPDALKRGAKKVASKSKSKSGLARR